MNDSVLYPTKTIKYSKGEAHNLGRAKPEKVTLKTFVGLFRKPVVTPEPFREYKSASDERQRNLKGVGGWFMRAMVEKGVRNRNSIMPSQIITLDIDYADPQFVEDLLGGRILTDYFIMAHSTRSSTPENPRLRLMVFLKGNVSRDDYQAASRIVAQIADPEMKHTDKVSFRPAQMMYMPTVSKDMEKHYIFYVQEGDLLDHEEVVAEWEQSNGSSSDIGNLPKTIGEDDLRETELEAEDPLTKKGPVGDFCRAYSISELIEGKNGEEGLLADHYTPTEWANGAISRMTYNHGTTSNGAVVYEDKFVFSHHGSDPAQEQLVNAYDLVRIHLFGDKDKKVERDTLLKDLPSTKEMTELLRDDKNFRSSQAESRYDLESMLGDDDVDYDEVDDRPEYSLDDDGNSEADDAVNADIADLVGDVPSLGVKRRRKNTRKDWAKKPPKKWIPNLDLTDDGLIKVTMWNMAHIVLNDPRMWRKVAFNEFSKSVVMVGDFRSKMELIGTIECDDKVNGVRWQEKNDLVIRTLMEAPSGAGQTGYGIKVGKETVHDAIRVAAYRNSFHPIVEYLDDLRDKPVIRPSAIDTMLIDYFGCEDNAYYRAVSRLIMIASVARVEQPGCKFDTAPILEGAQGIGKSSAIAALYGESYFGEIDVNLQERKAVAEQIGGKWVLELPELSAMHKSEANDAKAFMSRQKDDVRMSYDRNISEFPRQCVIWGTTNDKKYLRDTTGGRRYLVVECGAGQIDVHGLLANRDILWQSAALAYDEMVEEFGESLGDLPLYLTGEAAKVAKILQEGARKKEVHETWFEAILDWMDEDVPINAVLRDLDGDDGDLLDEAPERVIRVAMTQKTIMREIIGSHSNVPTSAPLELVWEKVRTMLREAGWNIPSSTVRVGGKKARWITRPDMTEAERLTGYRLIGGDKLDADDLL